MNQNKWNYIDHLVSEQTKVLQQVKEMGSGFVDIRRFVICEPNSAPRSAMQEKMVELWHMRLRGFNELNGEYKGRFLDIERIYNCQTGEYERLKDLEFEIPIKEIHSWRHSGPPEWYKGEV